MADGVLVRLLIWGNTVDRGENWQYLLSHDQPSNVYFIPTQLKWVLVCCCIILLLLSDVRYRWMRMHTNIFAYVSVPVYVTVYIHPLVESSDICKYTRWKLHWECDKGILIDKIRSYILDKMTSIIYYKV